MTEDPKVIDVSQTDGVTVIHLDPDMFDQLHIASFRRQLLGYIKDHQPDKLVVSLDRVQTLGSECIGILVHALNRTRREGGDLRLCNLSELCMSLFQICNLVPQVFKAYPSSADAIKSYQQ